MFIMFMILLFARTEILSKQIISSFYVKFYLVNSLHEEMAVIANGLVKRTVAFRHLVLVIDNLFLCGRAQRKRKLKPLRGGMGLVSFYFGSTNGIWYMWLKHPAYAIQCSYFHFHIQLTWIPIFFVLLGSDESISFNGIYDWPEGKLKQKLCTM